MVCWGSVWASVKGAEIGRERERGARFGGEGER